MRRLPWSQKQKEKQEDGKAVLDYWFSGPRFAWIMRWHPTKKRKFVRRGSTKHVRDMRRQARRQP